MTMEIAMIMYEKQVKKNLQNEKSSRMVKFAIFILDDMIEYLGPYLE